MLSSSNPPQVPVQRFLPLQTAVAAHHPSGSVPVQCTQSIRPHGATAGFVQMIHPCSATTGLSAITMAHGLRLDNSTGWRYVFTPIHVTNQPNLVPVLTVMRPIAARRLPFTSPPMSDVVGNMIARRKRDQKRERGLPLSSAHANGPAGLAILITDLAVEEATMRYYTMMPLGRRSGSHFAYRYPLHVIRNVQASLAKNRYIMPAPLPIVFLKPFDSVGSSCILQGQDGWAFIVPNEHTVWSVVLERGIDRKYTPIAHDHQTSRPVQVPVESLIVGTATFSPSAMVTSKFGVNLFRELPLLPTSAPMVDYLGAFILQFIDNMLMSQSEWDRLTEDIKDYLYDQAPHLFEGFKPYRAVPHIPLVKFLYIKFDANLVGCVDLTLTAVQNQGETIMGNTSDHGPDLVGNNRVIHEGQTSTQGVAGESHST